MAATDTTTPSLGNSASLASTGAAGSVLGTESTLSNWVGPYATNMLGQGQALASQPYQAYQGPLTAGTSGLQQQAFAGLSGLTLPTQQQMTFTPQQYTGQNIAQYMNPYMEQILNPQLAEATRQAQIQNLANRADLTKAGAYGGGRGALMESEGQRNLQTNLANIYGQGLQKAYDTGMAQFNADQNMQFQIAQNAQNYGLQTLQKQMEAGAAQRAVEQEGLTADKAQFEEQSLWPYKQTQFLQSLLQGLPTSTASYSYSQPSTLSNITGGAGSMVDLYNKLFPASK